MKSKTLFLLNRTPFVRDFNAKIRSLTSQRRLVLGIESSCDDTCCSVISVNSNCEPSILSDCRQCDSRKHTEFGGILPQVVSFMHSNSIESVVRNAFNVSGIDIHSIDAIGVSNRPGLLPSLRIGTEYAKRLSLKYNKPLIPVHHMEAHALTAGLNYPQLKFPFLSLLISGGHCQILLVTSVDNFLLLGEAKTKVSPGETLDKIARVLKVKNLGPPFDRVTGGRALELLAKFGNPNAYFSDFKLFNPKLPKSCNFHFSGIRTLVESKIKQLEEKSSLPVDCPIHEIADIAASVLSLFTRYIWHRIRNAIYFLESSNILKSKDRVIQSNSTFVKDYTIERQPVKLQLAISGGVACNKYITETLKELCENANFSYADTEIEVIVPEPKLCTDNAVMIAWNAYLKLLNDSNDVLVNKEQIEAVDIDPKAPFANNISDLIEKI
ncbi:tRNA N6-adenosine threonylcarbamoyltransferase-like protein [Leptotrombidium deliense]|uniref:N(6)-L-threonylcarbamoyladenine synthase n=1 Tax=Leptotrombidium deliense TaxID=299467 RepID=A0A443SUN3_9ACAR|nr:tRNA N6-adenosine threonylcarbamoyltransferase-like protein [Leptotrombidium deliense]